MREYARAALSAREAPATDDTVRAALAELVSLKALKDKIELLKTVPNAEHPIVIVDRNRMEADYHARKDAAWRAARVALGLPHNWGLDWVEAEELARVSCAAHKAIGPLPTCPACRERAQAASAPTVQAGEAHSKSEYKRRVALGDSNVTPPSEAAGEQPVAYQRFVAGAWVECSYFVAYGWGNEISPNCRALYTSPQPASPAQARMPLSEEQIEELAIKAGLVDEMWFGKHTPKGYEDTLPKLRRFADAVRAAHGVSGESSGAAPGVDQPDGAKHG